jgi:sRNA-binding regulator protein Hfq
MLLKVMSKEMIKLPKKFFSRSSKKNDNLSKLENTIIKVASRYNQYGFIDPTEEKFLEENKGKKITVELSNNQDITGILEVIDKYRIGIILDSEVHYYYKHAVISYYSVE